ncbi:MAG: PQQ-dependent sugar dehydrogenase, partial [Planctomycetales bacterium]|nr:PQQ-dependent sugar dehydrogenase [Planctomycetales bacterium]
VTGTTRHAVAVNNAEFTIEQVAELDDQPLRLAIDDAGTVYVCYDYFKKHGAWGGVVLRYLRDEAGQWQHRIVIESPILARCYGLAVRDGDLYVSRSGYYPKAELGRVTYERTGAITQLRDLDGDGYYEYAHDVVTDLPGVRAPDTMQQNNGMLFGPDGSLYVTNASAADRTLDEHPWGGAILKFDPDFSNPQIFAKGFRNPWTITLGPDDSLFATDSDVDENPGDEINHVLHGEHYGHPFVIPNEQGVEAVGFRAPMFVGERETVFLGMVYATTEALPEEYRNCLYVTDFRLNRVLRLKLAKEGDSFKVTDVIPFAQVPSPVDMVMSKDGDFYVISRRAQKLYRIHLKKQADN